MKRKAITIMALGICFSALASSAFGGFDEGQAAYKAGDYAIAFSELKPLADQGGASAQYILGVMYFNALGVPQNYAESVKWYRKAAEQGNASSQRVLGWIFANGRGVPRDVTEAARWYRIAVAQGDASAKDWFHSAVEQGDAETQFAIGEIYRTAEGGPQDYAEAVKWYRKAADQGHASAQFSLGVRYDNGQGVPQDQAEAVKWYRLAADQGDASAQNNLGAKYANGEGVGKNYFEAAYWYAMAARQGNEMAKVNIAKNLSNLPEKRVRAQVWALSDHTTKSKTVKQLNKGETVYIIGSFGWQDGWQQIYIPDGHAVGWVRVSSLDVPRRAEASSAGGNSTPASLYPARPSARTGYVTCNTRCMNGDCYRTYSSGKKVHFQARMRINPFTNQMEFDSGGC